MNIGLVKGIAKKMTFSDVFECVRNGEEYDVSEKAVLRKLPNRYVLIVNGKEKNLIVRKADNTGVYFEMEGGRRYSEKDSFDFNTFFKSIEKYL